MFRHFVDVDADADADAHNDHLVALVTSCVVVASTLMLGVVELYLLDAIDDDDVELNAYLVLMLVGRGHDVGVDHVGIVNEVVMDPYYAYAIDFECAFVVAYRRNPWLRVHDDLFHFDLWVRE